MRLSVAARLTAPSSSPAAPSEIPLCTAYSTRKATKPTPAALASAAASASACTLVRPAGGRARSDAWGDSSDARRQGGRGHREHRRPEEGPAPAERDRHGGQRQPREQGAQRGAGLLGAEGQALTLGGHLAPEQRAHRGSADRVARAGHQEQRRAGSPWTARTPPCHACDRGEGRAEPHPARGADSLDQAPGGRGAETRDHVEGRHRQPHGGIAEGEVVADARSQARREEAGHHAGHDQSGARHERPPRAAHRL